MFAGAEVADGVMDAFIVGLMLEMNGGPNEGEGRRGVGPVYIAMKALASECSCRLITGWIRNPKP